MSIPILLFGGIFNLIVFLSLKTFRKKSCSLYLMIMPWFNIGQLLTGNLSRMINAGYNIDWTHNSLFYSSLIFSILHEIPSIIYSNYGHSALSNQPIYIITNSIYQQYKAYGYFLVLAGFLPVFIPVIFGSLAYKNAPELTYRTVPNCSTFTVMMPYNMYVTVATILNLRDGPVAAAKLQFAESLTIAVYYSYFAAPFYIYVSVSRRFRQQLIYVLSQTCVTCFRRQRVISNQVLSAVDGY
ncbi:unnamed protein product [Rotaria socialis]|uniref:Uncharacterized protein n=2 Tax=Rotaria socialis TaxID=392032 RepID=A0A817XQB7_9BILA|nr:unnamed protein product [Rotaria socialis]CAF3460285.1 unnamed protein product [Rotaria socialis]CAF3705305.1 unnamed protein product [Rotaria socialis]